MSLFLTCWLKERSEPTTAPKFQAEGFRLVERGPALMG